MKTIVVWLIVIVSLIWLFIIGGEYIPMIIRGLIDGFNELPHGMME